jgi:DNA-binding transcriptional MerR regulator
MGARPRSRKQELAAKPYLKIGEAAELLGVATSLLRYWETEFRVLRPQKTRSNQRLYRPADIARLREIQRLLKVEGYTIEGARRQLRKGSSAAELEAVRAELADLRRRHDALRAVVDREARTLAELGEGSDGSEGSQSPKEA